jgi:hypothetical protein
MLFSTLKNLRSLKMEPEILGYCLEDPSKIREFKNLDLWDTLNHPTVKALWQGKAGMTSTNQIFLTAFATLENGLQELRSKVYELENQLKNIKEEKDALDERVLELENVKSIEK